MWPVAWTARGDTVEAPGSNLGRLGLFRRVDGAGWSDKDRAVIAKDRSRAGGTMVRYRVYLFNRFGSLFFAFVFECA
jgi:hypothetical protein